MKMKDWKDSKRYNICVHFHALHTYHTHARTHAHTHAALHAIDFLPAHFAATAGLDI